VNPRTPIVVRVSGGRLNAVTVTNPRGKRVSGALAPGGQVWRTTEPLGYATNYAVLARATGVSGRVTERHRTIHTLTPRAQSYPSVVPAPGPDVTVGVGQPVVVRFDRHIPDRAAVERTLRVTTTPAQPGGWYWVSDREVHYRPRVYWRPGSRVSVAVDDYGVDLGDGIYGETDQRLDFRVHDSWIAVADGASERMEVFHNGQSVRLMPISMGKDSTPTHAGPHVISDKRQRFIMDSCSYGVCPPSQDWYRREERFDERISNDGEFVHENPASVAQQGNANVSHGCINLSTDNAAWFFARFGLGDVVEVTNSGGPRLPVWDLYGDWEVPWSIWSQGNAAQ
jgi:lipoprotein-anchoring transpeptidase ErfK/SrfK